MRVALVFVIYVPAVQFARDGSPDHKALFALLVLMAVLTDILDGPLARHLGTASRFGANVDSAADLLFYVSFPIWAYMFRPALVMQLAPVMAAVVILYLIANFTAQRIFGRFGVHNRLSRTSGTVGILVAFYTILWGFNVWLAYALVAILVADLSQRYGNIAREWFRRRGAAQR